MANTSQNLNQFKLKEFPGGDQTWITAICL